MKASFCSVKRDFIKQFGSSLREYTIFTDALVYLHQGVKAVDEQTYFGLFVYPDGMEITDVEVVE